MEIGARVEAEDVLTGEIRHTASAYLTFVSLNPDGKPRQIPALICETERQKVRHEEALLRKQKRFEDLKLAREREQLREQRTD